MSKLTVSTTEIVQTKLSECRYGDLVKCPHIKPGLIFLVVYCPTKSYSKALMSFEDPGNMWSVADYEVTLLRKGESVTLTQE